MSDKRLCNKNHLLATDNWYTSVVLAIFLLSIGVHFLGTCKSNKKYIPKRALYKRTGKNKKERGVFEVNTTDVDVVDATSGRKLNVRFISPPGWITNRYIWCLHLKRLRLMWCEFIRLRKGDMRERKRLIFQVMW